MEGLEPRKMKFSFRINKREDNAETDTPQFIYSMRVSYCGQSFLILRNSAVIEYNLVCIFSAAKAWIYKKAGYCYLAAARRYEKIRPLLKYQQYFHHGQCILTQFFQTGTIC